MAEKAWKYDGPRTEGSVPAGLENPADELLVDFMSLDALRKEQARVLALWRDGKLTHSAGRAGVYMLDKMVSSCVLAMSVRMQELEALVERLEAQVALRHTPTPPRPGSVRLLS